MKIYHNPRCSKSRQAIAYLDEKGLSYEIVKYMDNPFSKSELRDLLDKIGIGPAELLRKNEKFYKDQIKGGDWTEDQLVDFMLIEPKLIERPIVEKGEKAVIGRPTESIDSLL